MNKEEIQDILEELHLVRPEILQPKARKLFEAIMSIADERDDLLKQNKELHNKIDKAIEIVDKWDYSESEAIDDYYLKEDLLKILKDSDVDE